MAFRTALSVVHEHKFSELRESDKSLAEFKDPVSQLFLAGTMVASLFLTQEVAGSNLFDDKCLSH